MSFRSRYSNRPVHKTCTGSPEYKEVRVKFSPDGNMSLEYGKVHNRQDEINSFKGACDVNMMIRRYENGDSLALMRNPNGAYADLSDVPENIHEMRKLARNAESIYSKMGDDIKALYPTFGEFTEAFSSVEKFEQFRKNTSEVIKNRKSAYEKRKEVKSDA